MATDAVKSAPLPGLEVVPGWEQYPWLRAGFSTRVGGRSQAYGADEQNLGWTAEEDISTVQEARRAFAARVAGNVATPTLVTVQQVHGAVVRDMEQEPMPWRTEQGKATMEADGMISLRPGRLLAILTADCVPVLVADTRTHAVGAFHAGWRGTLAQIVRRGVEQMQSRYRARSEDLVAAIGPCIGACCFQIGEDVRMAFREKLAETDALFTGVGSDLRMDLVAANRNQLLESGVPFDNVSTLTECTACTRLSDGRRKYFSYRAEDGRTGRMLSGIAAVA